MANAKLLELETRIDMLKPKERRYWIALAKAIPDQMSRTTEVGPKCKSVEELRSVVARIKADLDAILEEAERLPPL